MWLHRTLLAGCVLFCAAGLVACADDGGTPTEAPLDQKTKDVVVLDAAKGRVFTGPKLRVEKGEDRMVCWVPDWTPDQDYYVSRFLAHQGSMGHHLLAMKSEDPLPPGKTFDCSDVTDMLNLRPLVLPDNSTKKDLGVMPPDHAVRMPKGTTIVFQSHYINYGDRALEFQDIAELHMLPTPPQQEVNYLIVNASHFTVLPGETTSVTTPCVLPADVTLIATMGHMHEWGQAIEVSVKRANPLTGATQPLYLVAPWLADYRDAPPVQVPPLADATLFKGDTLQVTCTWKNDTTKPLAFPHEMCSSISYYKSPTPKGLILCDP